jgi:hypothetical protein
MIVTILLISIVLLVVYVGSQRLSGLAMAAIFVIASGGIALVVSPQLASRIAQAIGVGRGTDLVLYVGVIGGLFGSAYFSFACAGSNDVLPGSRRLSRYAKRPTRSN